MDMSNKSLALLLVAAIVISLGGTMISLSRLNEAGFTGYAAGGNVSLTVSSNASCVVSNNVSFGTGGQPPITINLSTEDDHSAYGFNNCESGDCTGINIENNGNVNLLVNFSSNFNATELLVQQSGLTQNDFMFKIKNGTNVPDRQGCIGAELTDWSNVNKTDIMTVCDNLTSGDTADTVTIEFNVTLEPDIVAGTKTAILTINCGQN
ncbi:hypothetical protein JXB28_01950 [Candidatus Woesearchaeota archaeon]|nr:hypothetical protein [Candidatus Woesearchaeota archaeon]